MNDSPFLPISTDSLAHEGAAALPPAGTGRRRRGLKIGGRFLWISIAAHLLFLAIAAYLIVQTIHGKREQTFASAPRGPNAPTRALEKQVQMAKKKASGAPASPKRVVANNANAKVVLPTVANLPKLDALTPMKMAGAGGTGVGPGFGNGGPGGGPGGGNGGQGLNFFGLRNRGGGSLVGHLFDLKQDRNRKPAPMDNGRYEQVARQVVMGNRGAFNSYFQASVTLYTTQMFTPAIDANEAPKAFGVDQEVQPRLWMADYKGRVIPSESGTYRFVGFGDDMLVVRFNGKIVLDSGYICPSGLHPNRFFHYSFNAGGWYEDPHHTRGHGEGLQMEVEANKSYDMEVLIGEEPGGTSMFQLMIEKDGVEYQKDGSGNPILPIFRLAPGDPPTDGRVPPTAPEGPIWKAEAPSATAAGGV